MSHHPNSELVAVALLKLVTDLGGRVATELPADNSTWSSSGFVQVASVGGTPNLDLPIASPIVSVDCWAVSPNSGKPPWGKAAGLAEFIRWALTRGTVVLPARVTLPTGYASADVVEARFLTEPRRIRDDAADYAHYQFDMQIGWVEV